MNRRHLLASASAFVLTACQQNPNEPPGYFLVTDAMLAGDMLAKIVPIFDEAFPRALASQHVTSAMLLAWLAQAQADLILVKQVTKDTLPNDPMARAFAVLSRVAVIVNSIATQIASQNPRWQAAAETIQLVEVLLSGIEDWMPPKAPAAAWPVRVKLRRDTTTVEVARVRGRAYVK